MKRFIIPVVVGIILVSGAYEVFSQDSTDPAGNPGWRELPQGRAEGGGRHGRIVVNKDGKVILYNFVKAADGKINVGILESSPGGPPQIIQKQFDSEEALKKEDPELYKLYERAMVGAVGTPLPVQRFTVEQRLEIIERCKDPEKQKEYLPKLEEGVPGLLRRFNDVLKKVKGVTLADVLDLNSMQYYPECVLPCLRVRPVDSTLASHLGLEGGMVVVKVCEEPSSTKDGLEVNDVITKVHKTDITGIESLNDAVKTAPRDGKVDIKIIRKGKEKTLKVALPELPKEEAPVEDE